jgi:hypothetical protein
MPRHDRFGQLPSTKPDNVMMEISSLKPLLARRSHHADRDVAMVDDVERDAAEDNVGHSSLAVGANDEQISAEPLCFADDRRARPAFNQMRPHFNADLACPLCHPCECLLSLLAEFIERLGRVNPKLEGDVAVNDADRLDPSAGVERQCQRMALGQAGVVRTIGGEEDGAVAG